MQAAHDCGLTRKEPNRTERTIDLHGYALDTIRATGLVRRLVEQAWEMGVNELTVIHGHGLWRGLPRPFANTNTGVLGLEVRSTLRRSRDLRRWMYSRIDVQIPGVTVIHLRPNLRPTRINFEELPEHDYLG